MVRGGARVVPTGEGVFMSREDLILNCFGLDARTTSRSVLVDPRMYLQ